MLARIRGVGDVRIEVDSSVGELAEGSLLLQLGGLLGILQTKTIPSSVIGLQSRTIISVSVASAASNSTRIVLHHVPPRSTIEKGSNVRIRQPY